MACGRTDKLEAPSSNGGIGTSGASGTGGVASAGTGGVTLAGAPPFSIPVAPLPVLRPCDSTAVPEPVGFLADGRPLVIQRLNRFDGASPGDLVRAWDPSTRELETLVVTESSAGLQLSGSGRRLFEVSSPSASVRGYRIHDLVPGPVSSSELIPVPLLGISGDGSFVLDESLRRLTALGEPDLDFAPLLSERVRAQARYAALSFAGNAIAIPWREAGGETWKVEVVHEDGRALTLAGAPALENCCNAFEPGCSCNLSFSHDGRYLLVVSYGQLRVWDTATAAVVLQLDGTNVQRASFVYDTDRVLVVRESGATEHSRNGSEQFPTSINHRVFASGPRATLGYLDGTLVVVKREQVLERWPQPRQTWASAVAVTEDAAFAIVPDRDVDALFPLMLARYEWNIAGPTALFRPRESQSEWEGEIKLSPDERRLAVVFPDSVGVLDSKTLEPLATLPTGAGAIAWSPDGRYLVTAPDLHYRDVGRPAYMPRKTLDFWDAASGQPVASYSTPVHTHTFAFSADGSKIVAWGENMKLRQADDHSPESVRVFVGTGEARAFMLNAVTGGISESALGRIIGSTREVVATERGVFRVSTAEPVSLFGPTGEAGLPLQVVLAPDASVGVLLRGPLTRGQLFAVADAERATEAPIEGARTSVALAPGGRRLVVDEAIYCAAAEP